MEELDVYGVVDGKEAVVVHKVRHILGPSGFLYLVSCTGICKFWTITICKS